MNACFSLALVATLLPLSRASLFITHPYAGITCHGGSACSLTWADDGNAPLLSAIGVCDIALYQGTDTIVQQLAAGIDVSQTHELPFTPDADAGPNSDSYWIKVTALSARDPNSPSNAYTSYSGFFTLDGMSGETDKPVPSLTSTLPLPTSSSNSSGLSGLASDSTSVSNGVVGTTTLPGAAPTGPSFSLSIHSVPSSASGSGSAGPQSSSTGPGASTTSGSESGSGSQSATSASSTSTSPVSSSAARRGAEVRGMGTGLLGGLVGAGVLLGAAVTL
ncbi:hypothetical protein M0805_004684 [Coniferiporia weirii]|nr:hypothetical protein M0805_004684 [Coniferiporia weirii]